MNTIITAAEYLSGDRKPSEQQPEFWPLARLENHLQHYLLTMRNAATSEALSLVKWKVKQYQRILQARRGF